MGRKHLAVNRQQTSLRATKVLSTAKTNGYKKSKNVNAGTSEKQSVKMSASRSKIRLEEAEEEQEDVGSCIVSNKPIKQQLRVHKPSVCIVADIRRRRTVSCCSRPLSCLWHLYKKSHQDVFIAACSLNYL